MATPLVCVNAQGTKTESSLDDLLTPGRRDIARAEANRWIKRLRLVDYGGQTMRQRFTYKGDSLWWFTELYLHKMRRLDTAVATIVALEAALDAFSPASLTLRTTDAVVCAAASAFARAHALRIDLPDVARPGQTPWWSSYQVGLTAALSRLRSPATPSRLPRTEVAAFVHTAFWRGQGGTSTALDESYVGPVLDALAARVPGGTLRLVGVGPRRNFRARRWWDPLARRLDEDAVTPIERFGTRRDLAGSMALWRGRYRLAHSLVEGAAIRETAIVRQCDLWPVLRPALLGAALVQWPWSARAMDEAAAALDALEPRVLVTYAEAGGWGRALVLEARRRGVPSAGIQHGFIYRHWLNYEHDADELLPSTDTVTAAHGAGFPAPDRTLVFDRLTAEHLRVVGHFPDRAIAVTGSPKLDALATQVAQWRADRQSIREQLGVGSADRVVVLAAKFSEIGPWVRAVMQAVMHLPGVHLIVKTHPAETADPYEAEAVGRDRVSVAPPTADLARLLAIADGLITLNSTVAVDSLVLGIPTLVTGGPSNLARFVEEQVMLAAPGPDVVEPLRTLLYDQGVRTALFERIRTFAHENDLRADGRAAERAANEILAIRR